jgi:hypothetical protein
VPPPADYLDEVERRIDAHIELERVKEWCTQHRRGILALPLPRNECPGCFSTIYDGAAEQGWCCDCHPRRALITSTAKEKDQ